MKFLKKIFNRLKKVFFIPISLINIRKPLNKLILIENKLDILTQKINDLDLISTKLYRLLQEHKNTNILKNEDLIELELKALVSKIEAIIENHFLQIEALLSIYNSLPNLKFMPATRGWAGSPDFLNKIIEIILKQKPRFVLEVSSGVSSILIGLALKMNNSGKALSLEHDPLYAEVTRRNIKNNDIENISTVFDSPINPTLIDGETWKWYETKDLTFPDKIDLLIIDGPPRTTQNLARYPAIPLLYPYFSDNVIILLDDAKRPDEIIIIEKWIEFLKKENCKINIERYLNYEKGMVLLNLKK